jgi:hypothetical protein
VIGGNIESILLLIGGHRGAGKVAHAAFSFNVSRDSIFEHLRRDNLAALDLASSGGPRILRSAVISAVE